MYYRVIYTIEQGTHRIDTRTLNFTPTAQWENIFSVYKEYVQAASKEAVLHNCSDSMTDMTYSVQVVRYQTAWDESTADVIREVTFKSDIFSV